MSKKPPLVVPKTIVTSQTHMQVTCWMEVLAMQACVTGDSASLGMRGKDVSFTEKDDGDGDVAAAADAENDTAADDEASRGRGVLL
jgi:hypothetical protein